MYVCMQIIVIVMENVRIVYEMVVEIPTVY